ncbi:hypothetical protein DM01DRAFT_1411375 [Hesseltinella vesiculosa]|uniref:Alpha/beta hydrolase fold-3 domain-containing protein n=1 Tax=Hesseltinella vesiculosa TaxID=101127 RepID=A0A1X2G434_9FUNG|nr:hypothetical protein DM01DRAFT_1411375 [Hesseltinella vesiculosa]
MSYPYTPVPLPVYQAFFKEMPAANITLADQDIKVLRESMAPTSGTGPDVLENEFEVTAGGFNIKVFALRPLGTENDILPGLIYLHGGGFILGDYKGYSGFVKEICVHSHVAVLFVEYSLAPEATFPVLPEECYNATLWIHENAEKLKVDGSRLTMGGGNLTAVTNLMLHDRGYPDIVKGQIMLYPVSTVDNGKYESAKLFGKYLLSNDDMLYFMKLYLTDDTNPPDDFRFDPLLASEELLKTQPRTLILTAECDILRDGAEHYGQKLANAGVDVSCVRMIGGVHGFLCFPIDTGIKRDAMDLINKLVNQ